jgi:putative transcriptional regulator
MSELGDLLLQGLDDAIAYVNGDKSRGRETVVMVEVPKQIDVRAIRKKLGMSRTVFSAKFGFSVRSVQKWETGERQPEGPTRAYLTVIDRNPKAVEEALSAIA